jgi:hypothetical protein
MRVVADERAKRNARAMQFFRQAALAASSADQQILIVFLLSKGHALRRRF